MTRPADVRAVAAVLQQDHESAEDAARAVIEKLDELRRDRTRYAVAVQGLPLAYLYGDFDNREDSIRWLKRVGLDVGRLSVGVVPLFNKDLPLERHLKMTEELEAKNKPDPVKKRPPRKRAEKKAA